VYNIGIEVFDGGAGQGPAVRDATVNILGNVKITNEAGRAEYQLAAGDYPVRIEAAGFEAFDTSVSVGEDRTFQFGIRRLPPQSFNFVIEVFRGNVAANRRLSGARVFVDADSRTSDGNGFTHFWVPTGSRRIRVEATGFRPFEAQYVIDREHTGTFPSGDRPSYRVALEEIPPVVIADPFCTTRTVNDANTGLPKGLPNVLPIIERVHRANPNLVRESCMETGGNNRFLHAVLAELRRTDPRWGFNWKRGRIGDMSQDVINYYRGAGPFNDGTDTYVVDIIIGHCGPDPRPGWIDVTGVGGAIGRWTIDPAPKCP
jgi:hypothetical protein